MLRPKPLATVIAALALLALALLFAPITASGQPTLSPTPPVTLKPPSSTTTTTTTTTTTPRPQLPKTGYDAEMVALTGLGLVLAGEALRRVLAEQAARRRIAARRRG